ncbi:MAG: ATP synthase subunit I [Clostridia bacterium]|jgi:hypothetical protein|nr:ATP synthase subunit I [Clostridia bacterium]
MNEYNNKKIFIISFIIAVLFSIIASFIIKEDLYGFVKGVMFGSAFAVLKVKMIELNVKKILGKRYNFDSAYRSGMVSYYVRLMISLLILFVAIQMSKNTFIGVLFGFITPKLAIILISIF